MYKIKETIIVEGVYDKIKLSGFIDGIIFVTGGFSVMNDEKKCQSIKTLAEKTGIVILTDSDSAGFRIRNFIKQLVPSEFVKHAYVPDIKGKEKRKTQAGKEGLLGVEGMTEEIIVDALKKSGCQIDGNASKALRQIKKSDLYFLGLSGGNESRKKREKLTNILGLPSKISANMLLDVLNRLTGLDELKEICDDL